MSNGCDGTISFIMSHQQMSLQWTVILKHILVEYVVVVAQ